VALSIHASSPPARTAERHIDRLFVVNSLTNGVEATVGQRHCNIRSHVCGRVQQLHRKRLTLR